MALHKGEYPLTNPRCKSGLQTGVAVALVLLSALVLAESTCEEPREGQWDIVQSRVNPNDTNSYFNFAESTFELIKDQEQIYVGMFLFYHASG